MMVAVSGLFHIFSSGIHLKKKDSGAEGQKQEAKHC